MLPPIDCRPGRSRLKLQFQWPHYHSLSCCSGAHCLRIPVGGAREDSMSVVLTVSVVAAALVLLPVSGLILLMRNFDRIYDGLE